MDQIRGNYMESSEISGGGLVCDPSFPGIEHMRRSTRTLWRAVFRIGPHTIRSTWLQKPSWARGIVKTMKLRTNQDISLIGLEKKRVPLIQVDESMETISAS